MKLFYVMIVILFLSNFVTVCGEDESVDYSPAYNTVLGKNTAKPIIEIIDGRKVVQNQTFNTTLAIVGHKYDGGLIRNCTIEDLPKNMDGIYLKNVDNVTIENCTIKNLKGFKKGMGRGIKVSSKGSCSNITIKDCHLENIESDAISIAQRSKQDPPVVNRNVKILNNTIVNVAQTKDWPGHYHGIYCQGQDFLIEGNTIYSVIDGNGISVRSSGIIRGNIVYNVGQGSPIRYFNDHMKGPSDTLIIENNICYDYTYEKGQSGMVSLLSSPRNDPDFMVSEYIIRFNTLISMHKKQPATVTVSDQFADKNIVIVGNILGNRNNAYISGPVDVDMCNVTIDTLAGFKSKNKPFDFHITPDHPACNFATGLKEYPKHDIDGEKRKSTRLDAGADQIK